MIIAPLDSPFMPVLGALSGPSPPLPSDEDIATKRWFSDFDLYTMQRQPDLWYKFCNWRKHAQDTALKHPLLPGTMMTFEPNAFSRQHGLLRSPYPMHPIPSDTLASATSRRRTRNTALDRILSAADTSSFIITEVKIAGPDHFSQVFFGRVVGCEELLCVKLFDERYFPIPRVHDPACTSGDPSTRMTCLNYSEDLARREESVYHRLHDFQGCLLPFSYGFHVVCLAVAIHLSVMS